NVWDIIGPLMNRLVPGWVALTAEVQVFRTLTGTYLEAFNEARAGFRTL
ncbi:13131_t:CDS:1, partial [Racocetra persica]